MAALAAAAPMLSTVATIAGTAFSVIGNIREGNAQRAQAEQQAKEAEVASKNAFAESSREAAQYKREKEYALSTAQARGAASGVGRSLDIEAEIASFGDDQVGTSISRGLAEKDRLLRSAANYRATGKAAQTAGYIGAAGAAFGGATNYLADKYGQGGYGATGKGSTFQPGYVRGGVPYPGRFS